MPKITKHNVDRQFEITSKDVEKIADYAIEYQVRKNKVPLFSITCKMVMAELASKYTIISRMKKEVLNGLAKFIGDTIMETYIWESNNITVAQKVN